MHWDRDSIWVSDVKLLTSNSFTSDANPINTSFVCKMVWLIFRVWDNIITAWEFYYGKREAIPAVVFGHSYAHSFCSHASDALLFGHLCKSRASQIGWILTPIHE